MNDTLFPDLVPLVPLEPEPVEKLSADRRRTLRQRADVDAGRHPLTRGRLSADEGATCGSCRFRLSVPYHNKSYPKCIWRRNDVDAATYESNTPPPFVSHSASSDVRAWWPGCANHEWGDTKLSPDAARWRPSPVGVVEGDPQQ